MMGVVSSLYQHDILRLGAVMDSADFIINSTAASLRIEGFDVTDDDKSLLRRCIQGELSYDEAVMSVLDEYRHE